MLNSCYKLDVLFIISVTFTIILVKKKSGGERLKKKNLEQMVISLFEENPTQVFELKTLYRELHLNTHPAKMLLMDVLEVLLMDDYIKEQPRFCYTLNNPTQVMEGIFHRKANGKNY